MSDEADLAESTGVDIRSVAVVWNCDGESSPEVFLSGISEYEAAGLLRAALSRLEDGNAGAVVLADEEEDERFDE